MFKYIYVCVSVYECVCLYMLLCVCVLRIDRLHLLQQQKTKTNVVRRTFFKINSFWLHFPPERRINIRSVPIRTRLSLSKYKVIYESWNAYCSTMICNLLSQTIILSQNKLNVILLFCNQDSCWCVRHRYYRFKREYCHHYLPLSCDLNRFILQFLCEFLGIGVVSISNVYISTIILIFVVVITVFQQLCLPQVYIDLDNLRGILNWTSYLI